MDVPRPSASHDARGTAYWRVSLVISLFYFVFFLLWRSCGPPSEHNESWYCKWIGQGLYPSQGFCVLGFTVDATGNQGTCHSWVNSHTFAFGVDCVFSIIGLVLAIGDSDRFLKLGSVLVIASHGALHGFYNSFHCYLSGDGGGPILYTAFTFLLFIFIYIILWFQKGDHCVQNVKYLVMILVFAACASIPVAGGGASNSSLQLLFSLSHVVGSFSGLYAPDPHGLVRWPLAVTFLIATVVGLLELLTCDIFYRMIGGHVLYDLTLHISVLSSIPTVANWIERIARNGVA